MPLHSHRHTLVFRSECMLGVWIRLSCIPHASAGFSVHRGQTRARGADHQTRDTRCTCLVQSQEMNNSCIYLQWKPLTWPFSQTSTYKGCTDLRGHTLIILSCFFPLVGTNSLSRPLTLVFTAFQSISACRLYASMHVLHTCYTLVCVCLCSHGCCR